jgi:hypothetical protein
MAELVSPGVSITVTDESFYAAAGAGTVPLIVIATAQNKSAPDGSGIAAYTTADEAGKVHLINSQRDLLTKYGNPSFTSTNAGELNEYGLHAAYSFLGIANRAYVLRADVDLSELTGSVAAPSAAPADGSYWLDTSGTVWGLKRWDGSSWVRQSLLAPSASQVTVDSKPKDSIGTDGAYAVVYQDVDEATLAHIKLYEKISGTWFQIGTPDWDTASSADYQIAPHTLVPSARSTGGSLTAGDLYLQTNALNNGSTIAIKEYSASAGLFLNQVYTATEYSWEAYRNYVSYPSVGDLWVKMSNEDANISLFRHTGSTSLTVSGAELQDDEIDLTNHTPGTIAFSIVVNNNDKQNGASGQVDVSLNSFDSDGDGNASVDDIVEAINSALSSANASLSDADKLAVSNVSGVITIVNTAGTDLDINAGNVAGFDPEAALGLPVRNSNWSPLSFTASDTALTGSLAEGTLWYDNLISSAHIDILYKAPDSTWAAYPYDVTVSATAPASPADNDLWIDSGDLENYPTIYKYDSTLTSTNKWALVDNTDSVTEDGIIFADFRNAPGAIIANDAPSASFYPLGMLAWNKRASGGNVKEWDATNERWVDYSGNFLDGRPRMLRKAQRAAVVKSLQAAIQANQDIRAETTRFNLIASPGYPELMDEMITLNTDRKETAFVIGDSPMRLSADSSATLAWATNANGALENGEEGLTSSYAYSAVYYPHGVTSNLDGSTIVVPSSTIALRTMAYNDQVAFPWFAPAGFQRGVVTNATSVGYVDSETGAFVPVSLNEGQRDSLYLNKINPVANFPGRGISVFGQKTLSPIASALDRVNVARLVVYIRERLDDIVKPFLFEPNDSATRADAKAVVDRFLANLVTQRGLYDFVAVCDETNNTPERIDRNELHIDIAIQPVKAVEFIYIPIRVQNTLGETG